LLSPSTEAVDRGPKKRIYERLLKVSEYFFAQEQAETEREQAAEARKRAVTEALRAEAAEQLVAELLAKAHAAGVEFS